VKKLIPTILIIMLCGCATVKQSPNDLREKMNSVHIGMTHQEVENLIGKPNSVTTHDTPSGRMEICDYTFDTLNNANSAKSFIAGTRNGNEYLSMVVVYNNGLVLSVQRNNDFGSSENVASTQSHQGESKESPVVNAPTVSNSEQSHIVKPNAGVHVNKDMIVTRIVVDSPAYKAGLNINDIIVAFDGIPVSDTATLKRLADDVKFGDKKSIRVQRGSKILDLTICY